MFIRGNPIRFGCKICLCGSDGFPYHLSIYTSKPQDTGKPLGSCVRNAMVDIVENNSTLSNTCFIVITFSLVISYRQICQLEMCVKIELQQQRRL